jgi:3-oxoacyl-[acyl-carrier-protein] synthase II
MYNSRRVVITGLGAVAPNGSDTESFWSSTVKGVSGIRELKSFDTSDYPCRIAGEVVDLRPEEFMDRRTLQRTSRAVHLALASLHLSLRDSKLDLSPSSKSEAAVIYGVGCPLMDVIEPDVDAIRTERPRRIPPYKISADQVHSVAGAIKKVLGTDKSAFVVSSGCASGLESIGLAAEKIRMGQVDTVICGSTDAPLSPSTYGVFCASGIVSKRNSDPRKASRPFDAKRDGGVLSEGAGTLVLESLESALARGARIYGEILGFASVTEETNNQRACPEDASRQAFVRCMSLAMSEARVSPEDIDYICAHAPSDPQGDRIETEAIKTVFGVRSYRIPVSSIKSCIGNPVAAAGALQTIATSLAMRDGMVPPTINYEYPDPACDLDYVPNTCRRNEIDTALINSHGIGGTYSSLIVGSDGSRF